MVLPEATDSFHAVGRVFPGETSVVSVPPGTSARDALRLMLEHRFSQVPVVDGAVVRGMFSFQSVARELVDQPKVNLDQLAVEDAMEQVPTLTVGDRLDDALRLLDTHDAVLLGSARGPQAVLTATDALRYVVGIAHSFVLLGEIELAVRALIATCATADQVRECAEHALASRYKDPGRIPGTLVDMTFDEYIALITARDNWPLFDGPLGRNREVVRARLDRVRDLRNVVFHFRRGLERREYDVLVSARDWLRDKAQYAAGSAGGADV